MKVLLTGARGQVGPAYKPSPPLRLNCGRWRAGAGLQRRGCRAPCGGCLRPRSDHQCGGLYRGGPGRIRAVSGHAINASGPQHLAAGRARDTTAAGCCTSRRTTCSTALQRTYAPRDPPHPLSVYGRSKLEGERAVLELLAGARGGCCVRPGFMRPGKNFLLTMLRLMRERGTVASSTIRRAAPDGRARSRRRCGAWQNCRRCAACCIGPTPGSQPGTSLPARSPRMRGGGLLPRRLTVDPISTQRIRRLPAARSTACWTVQRVRRAAGSRAHAVASELARHIGRARARLRTSARTDGRHRRHLPILDVPS